jgi:hypothetical protein
LVDEHTVQHTRQMQTQSRDTMIAETSLGCDEDGLPMDDESKLTDQLQRQEGCGDMAPTKRISTGSGDSDNNNGIKQLSQLEQVRSSNAKANWIRLRVALQQNTKRREQEVLHQLGMDMKQELDDTRRRLHESQQEHDELLGEAQGVVGENEQILQEIEELTQEKEILEQINSSLETKLEEALHTLEEINLNQHPKNRHSSTPSLRTAGGTTDASSNPNSTRRRRLSMIVPVIMPLPCILSQSQQQQQHGKDQQQELLALSQKQQHDAESSPSSCQLEEWSKEDFHMAMEGLKAEMTRKTRDWHMERTQMQGHMDDSQKENERLDEMARHCLKESKELALKLKAAVQKKQCNQCGRHLMFNLSNQDLDSESCATHSNNTMRSRVSTLRGHHLMFSTSNKSLRAESSATRSNSTMRSRVSNVFGLGGGRIVDRGVLAGTTAKRQNPRSTEPLTITKKGTTSRIDSSSSKSKDELISKHKSPPPSANGILDLHLFSDLQGLLNDQMICTDGEKDGDLESLSDASQEEPTQRAVAEVESNASADGNVVIHAAAICEESHLGLSSSPDYGDMRGQERNLKLELRGRVDAAGQLQKGKAELSCELLNVAFDPESLARGGGASFLENPSVKMNSVFAPGELIEENNTLEQGHLKREAASAPASGRSSATIVHLWRNPVTCAKEIESEVDGILDRNLVLEPMAITSSASTFGNNHEGVALNQLAMREIVGKEPLPILKLSLNEAYGWEDEHEDDDDQPWRGVGYLRERNKQAAAAAARTYEHNRKCRAFAFDLAGDEQSDDVLVTRPRSLLQKAKSSASGMKGRSKRNIMQCFKM